MTNYALDFISETESFPTASIPKALIGAKTSEKFGDKIQLVWRLYRLEDQKVWESIQKDAENGIFYSEINVENLDCLTEGIDKDFLCELLNHNAYFELEALDGNTKYSLCFSLESDKKVYGARGLNWSAVNVLSLQHNGQEWIHDTDHFWNFKKWAVIDDKKGYCEIKALAL